MDQEAKYWRDKWLDSERRLTSCMEMLRRKNFNTSGIRMKPYDKQDVAKKRRKTKLKVKHGR